MTTSVSVTTEQAERLNHLLDLARALASPARLALVGALAARPTEAMTIDELTVAAGRPAGRLERDLRQLVAVGLARVEAWAPTTGGEPRPARLTFDPQFSARMPGLIAGLAAVTGQLGPATVPPSDERAATLARFLSDGRLVSWPARPKRLRHVLEAIVERFAPGERYPERAVDAVLKEIYPTDHCTLRRALVDHRLLARADGLYWRTAVAAS